MTIRKIDVDTIAQSYLRDKVNSELNPYHSEWYPANVNTALLNTFTEAPPEAIPSARGWLNNKIEGSQVRTAATNLANYYTRVVRGAYGMHGNDSVYEYSDETRLNFSESEAANAWLNGSLTRFTVPLRFETYYRKYIANHINNMVAASNMRLQGWVSGTKYNNETWYNMARLNNQTVFGCVKFHTDTVNGRGCLVGISFRYASRVNEVAYFSVTENSLGFYGEKKSEHTADVRTAINTMTKPDGVITKSSAASLYNHAWTQINNNRDKITVDLTVCHNSGSTGGGHSSRGRR